MTTGRKGYRKLFRHPPKGYRYRKKEYAPRKQTAKKSILDASLQSMAIQDSFSELEAQQTPLVLPCSEVTDRVTPATEECPMTPKATVLNILPCSVALYSRNRSRSRALKPVRVLSLFDGLGTGRLCLENLGISIKEYFSSEVDENAISLLRYHYHNKVTHLGSVEGITKEVLECLGDIDLLLAAPPCNDLSRANPRRRHFEPGSSALLVFQFKRIMEYLRARAHAENRLFFWLCESTNNMDDDDKVTINSALQCEGIVRSSSRRHTCMTRKRLFCGNIPGLCDKLLDAVTAPLQLQHFLDPGNTATVQTIGTLTTSSASQRKGREKKLPVISPDGKERFLSVTEEETMFGFPRHWTDNGIMSITDRRKLLGKA